MRVERAQAADVPALVEIWHDGWHQAHAAVVPQALVKSRTPAEFEKRTLAHLAQTSVVRQNGHIVGFFMLEGDELYQFYVAHAFQRRGIARAMMGAAEAGLGPGPKWLACSVGNCHAAGFYEACGWQRGATVPYDVETSDGAQEVKVWQYEKVLPDER